MPKDKIFGEDVKRTETRPHSFIRTVFHSLNPSKYAILVTRTWKQAFDYLITLVFFMVFILFLLSIFRIAQVQHGLDRDFEKFETFTMEADFTLKEPIQYGRFFVMDNERNYTGEDILVTADGITSKSPLCILLRPICAIMPEPVKKPSSELEDVLSQADAIKSYAGIILVLLLPGLLLLFFAFYTLLFVIVIAAVTAISFMVTRVARFEISWKQLSLAAIYSSTLLILLSIVTSYLHAYYLIPMVAYIVFLTICIMLVGDRERPYRKES